MKNKTSSATYTYDALPQQTAAASLLAQLNSEGAKGYRAISYMSNGNPDGLLTLTFYMEDQTQSATFTYQSDTTPGTAALFVNQANTYGAQGYATDVWIDMVSTSFYFKASNCSGFLCMNTLTRACSRYFRRSRCAPEGADARRRRAARLAPCKRLQCRRRSLGCATSKGGPILPFATVEMA
jgi:hypothetical protein